MLAPGPVQTPGEHPSGARAARRHAPFQLPGKCPSKLAFLGKRLKRPWDSVLKDGEGVLMLPCRYKGAWAPTTGLGASCSRKQPQSRVKCDGTPLADAGADGGLCAHREPGTGRAMGRANVSS